DLFRVTPAMNIYDAAGEYHSLFYAESWLVVHFLFDHQEISNALTLFAATRNGKSLDEAVQAAFGMSIPKFDATLAKYARTAQFGYGHFDIAPAKPDEYTREALTDLESRTLLADLCLHSRDDTEKSRNELEELVKTEPNSFTTLRTLSFG